jgi:flagellar biosynthesis/type III secretory pathway protein FliH
MPRKNEKRTIKTVIPWELHMAVIKLQASEELDYEQACKRASQLIDTNSLEFKRAVQSEVNRLKKSETMTQINKGKKTWRKKGYNAGFKEGKKEGYQQGVNQYKITYPCSVCGKQLIMMAREKDHEAMKIMMRKAGWAHTTCLEKI